MTETEARPMDRKVYTPKTLAERWQCSDRTVHEMCNSGELRAFRVGRMFRIRAEDVEAYEKGEAPAAAPPEPAPPKLVRLAPPKSRRGKSKE